MIEKLPAESGEPSAQVIGTKINELIDKCNELDVIIAKMIVILTDMTITEMMSTFKDRFGVLKKDDKKDTSNSRGT